MTDAAPYSVPKEPGRWRALLLAALVHAALLGFLWIGVRWQNETPVTVEAEVWSPQVREAAPQPQPQPQPEPQPQPRPEPPAPAPEPRPKVAEPEPKPVEKDPEIALEQERIKREKERLAREREERLERERQEKLAREREEKQERERQERLAREKEERLEREREQKLAQQREEAKRAEAKRAEEQRRAEQEKAEKAEAARKLAQAEAAKKAAAEKKRKEEEAEAEMLAKAREQEMRRISGLAGSGGTGEAQKSQGGRADSGYTQRVGAKIKSNTIYNVPDDMASNPAVEYEVSLLPDGSLRSARKLKSSGIPGFDAAVLRAIEKSQPYPPDKSGTVPSGFILSHKPKDQ